MARSLVAASAVLLLGACATQPPPEGRDCFASSQVSGYNVIDDHHVRVTAGANRHYILSTDWNAHDLRWSEAIAIRSTTNWICVGNGLGVEVIGGSPRRHYPVNGIEREPEPPAAAQEG